MAIKSGVSISDYTPHSLEDIRAPSTEYLTAVGSEAVELGPSEMIRRFAERESEQQRIDGKITANQPFDEFDLLRPRDAPQMEVEKPAVVPAEEANGEYGHLGLHFTDPVPARTLEILVERKRREAQADAVYQSARKASMDRPQGGMPWTQHIASGAAELMAGMYDPVNLGSSLIPFVGEARFMPTAAGWLARAETLNIPGATGVLRVTTTTPTLLGGWLARTAAQSASGALGNLALAPITVASDLAEQREVSLASVFADVVFGAAFGGAFGALTGWMGHNPVTMHVTQAPLPAVSGRPPGGGPSRFGPTGPAGLGGPTAAPGAQWGHAWTQAATNAGIVSPGGPAQTATALSLSVFNPDAPLVQALNAVSPSTRGAVMRTAIAQIAMGKTIDVEPVLRMDLNYKAPMEDPTSVLRITFEAKKLLADHAAQNEARKPRNDPLSQPDGSARYHDLDPSELTVDAKQFQFKGGGDAAGVTDRLAGVKRWDPRLSGVAILWRAADGTTYVVDGHQRVGLANRLKAEGQTPVIHAMVLEEARGESAGFARALAAIKNISEGTGDAVDAAKIFREINRDQQLKTAFDNGGLPALPPSSKLVRDAQALAKLPDAAFAIVANGRVKPEQAAHVTRIISDPNEQLAAVAMLAKLQPATSEQARIVVEQMHAAGFRTEHVTDLFGGRDIAQALLLERAKVLEAAGRRLRQDTSVYRTLVERESLATQVGNILDRDANLTALTDEKMALTVLEALASRAGPVATALNDAARKISEGRSTRSVVEEFLKVVRVEATQVKSGTATTVDLRPPAEQAAAPDMFAPPPTAPGAVPPVPDVQPGTATAAAPAGGLFGAELPIERAPVAPPAGDLFALPKRAEPPPLNEGRKERITRLTEEANALKDKAQQEGQLWHAEFEAIISRLGDEDMAAVVRALSPEAKAAMRRNYELEEQYLDKLFEQNYERAVDELPEGVRVERAKTPAAEDVGQFQWLQMGPEYERRLNIYRESDGALIGSVSSGLYDVDMGSPTMTRIKRGDLSGPGIAPPAEAPEGPPSWTVGAAERVDKIPPGQRATTRRFIDSEIERIGEPGSASQREYIDNLQAMRKALDELEAREGTAAPEAEQRVVSFKTAKGSTYTVGHDGTTARDKAPRPEHPGDEGPQPKSDRTYYLTDEQANALAPPSGAEWRIVEHIDGTLSVATRTKGGKWGIAPSQKNIRPAEEPAVGLTPLELWNADRQSDAGDVPFRKLHFGNRIVSVDRAIPDKLVPTGKAKPAADVAVPETGADPDAGGETVLDVPGRYERGVKGAEIQVRQKSDGTWERSVSAALGDGSGFGRNYGGSFASRGEAIADAVGHIRRLLASNEKDKVGQRIAKALDKMPAEEPAAAAAPEKPQLYQEDVAGLPVMIDQKSMKAHAGPDYDDVHRFVLGMRWAEESLQRALGIGVDVVWLRGGKATKVKSAGTGVVDLEDGTRIDLEDLYKGRGKLKGSFIFQTGSLPRRGMAESRFGAGRGFEPSPIEHGLPPARDPEMELQVVKSRTESPKSERLGDPEQAEQQQLRLAEGKDVSDPAELVKKAGDLDEAEAQAVLDEKPERAAEARVAEKWIKENDEFVEALEAYAACKITGGDT